MSGWNFFCLKSPNIISAHLKKQKAYLTNTKLISSDISFANW